MNYLALETVQSNFMDFGTLPQMFGLAAEEVQAKRNELDQRLQALPAALHPYVLAMYANPVIRKTELARG